MQYSVYDQYSSNPSLYFEYNYISEMNCTTSNVLSGRDDLARGVPSDI